MDIGKFYIRCDNIDECNIVQEILFSFGYKWNGGDDFVYEFTYYPIHISREGSDRFVWSHDDCSIGRKYKEYSGVGFIRKFKLVKIEKIEG